MRYVREGPWEGTMDPWGRRLNEKRNSMKRRNRGKHRGKCGKACSVTGKPKITVSATGVFAQEEEPNTARFLEGGGKRGGATMHEMGEKRTKKNRM